MVSLLASAIWDWWRPYNFIDSCAHYVLDAKMTDPLELGKQRAKELGLKIDRMYLDGEPRNYNDYELIYRADAIHKLLGEGVETFGYASKWKWLSEAVCPELDQPNRQALLIGIKPIVEESEERKLLREIIQKYAAGPEWLQDWENRAKALLEKP